MTTAKFVLFYPSSEVMHPVELVEQHNECVLGSYYWRYQFLLAESVLVPQLTQWGAFSPGMNVFEFGCGEAGVLGAFVRAGAKRAVGVDISEYRIELGKLIASIVDLPLELEVCNLLEEPLQTSWCEQFDLVILRDVIEHLDDTSAALTVANTLLRRKGTVLVTFPPYYSPFGGHQHLLGTRLGMLPWIHLLPHRLFEAIVRHSVRTDDQREVRRLRVIRLTMRKFERAASQAGFEIEQVRLYALRPVYRFRFGLPALGLPRWLRHIPLADFVAMEALYLLRKS